MPPDTNTLMYCLKLPGIGEPILAIDPICKCAHVISTCGGTMITIHLGPKYTAPFSECLIFLRNLFRQVGRGAPWDNIICDTTMLHDALSSPSRGKKIPCDHAMAQRCHPTYQKMLPSGCIPPRNTVNRNHRRYRRWANARAVLIFIAFLIHIFFVPCLLLRLPPQELSSNLCVELLFLFILCRRLRKTVI